MKRTFVVSNESQFIRRLGMKKGDILYLAYDDKTAAPAFWLPREGPKDVFNTLSDLNNNKSNCCYFYLYKDDVTEIVEGVLGGKLIGPQVEEESQNLIKGGNVTMKRTFVVSNESQFIRSLGMKKGDIVYLARDDGSNMPAFWLPKEGPKDVVNYLSDLNNSNCHYLYLYKDDVTEIVVGVKDVLPNTPYMLMDPPSGMKKGDIVYLAYDDKTAAPAFWLPQIGPHRPMTIVDWYNDQSFGRNNSIFLNIDRLQQMVITDPSMEVKEPEEEPEEPNTDNGDEGEEVDMYYDTDPDPDVNTHYACVAVQPIEVMQSNMTHEQFVGFLRGNIIKYTCRMGRKDDVTKEAAKIKQYATWLEQALRGEKVQVNKH